MSERPRDRHNITVRPGQPLIGVPVVEDGQELVQYFTDDPDRARSGSDERLRAALAVIGAWSDLDWDEFSSELDRIRHASPPTPPIALDL